MEQQKKCPLQAVIFDVDGLMLDSERLVQRSWDITGEKMGYGPLGHNIYHTLGINLKGREENLKSVYGQEFPFDKFTEAYREESRKIQEAEGVPVKKGLLELMAFLKKEGFALAVATSSSQERTREKLKGCGVWGDFSVIICGDQVRRSKPDPEIYEKAGAALGADPGSRRAEALSSRLSQPAQLPRRKPELLSPQRKWRSPDRPADNRPGRRSSARGAAWPCRLPYRWLLRDRRWRRGRSRCIFLRRW